MTPQELLALVMPALAAIGAFAAYRARKLLGAADHLDRVFDLEAELAEHRKATAVSEEVLQRLLLSLPACVSCRRRPATWDDGAWPETGRAWCDDCVGASLRPYRSVPKRELPWRAAVRELRLDEHAVLATNPPIGSTKPVPR